MERGGKSKSHKIDKTYLIRGGCLEIKGVGVGCVNGEGDDLGWGRVAMVSIF